MTHTTCIRVRTCTNTQHVSVSTDKVHNISIFTHVRTVCALDLMAETSSLLKTYNTVFLLYIFQGMVFTISSYISLLQQNNFINPQLYFRRLSLTYQWCLVFGLVL